MRGGAWFLAPEGPELTAETWLRDRPLSPPRLVGSLYERGLPTRRASVGPTKRGVGPPDMFAASRTFASTAASVRPPDSGGRGAVEAGWGVHGIDATTLETNAALRSIVRQDDGRGYRSTTLLAVIKRKIANNFLVSAAALSS